MFGLRPISGRSAALCIVALVMQPAASGAEIVLSVHEKLNWETTPEGVAFAPLDGNRFEESYMAMVRLPGGLVSPAHSKSAAMHGVVVSGKMTHKGAFYTGPEKVLSTGDYYYIPAGHAHVSSCISSDDCVTFLYQDGPFDFQLTSGGSQ